MNVTLFLVWKEDIPLLLGVSVWGKHFQLLKALKVKNLLIIYFLCFAAAKSIMH